VSQQGLWAGDLVVPESLCPRFTADMSGSRYPVGEILPVFPLSGLQLAVVTAPRAFAPHKVQPPRCSRLRFFAIHLRSRSIRGAPDSAAITIEHSTSYFIAIQRNHPCKNAYILSLFRLRPHSP
jgi:hypothetical protein